jgi:hypothetical protein
VLRIPTSLLNWKKSFTVFVSWNNVTVEISWSMNKNINAMVINQNWTIKFKDAYCVKNWQVVRWIFIAKHFETITKKNTDKNDERCNWWNLDVKWVLIWVWKNDGIDTLIQNRRSNLNEWTNKTTWNSQSRRNQILQWASLLLEYNSALRSQLPPGAEIFNETLNVFKK